MYTLQATDIDNGSVFFNKLNANFAEAANPQPTQYTEDQCRTRFVQEMNKKAVDLGMTNTTFYEPGGGQPATVWANLATEYPQAYVADYYNTMSAYDALKLMLYAVQFPAIVSASRLSTFPATEEGAIPTSFTMYYNHEGSTVAEDIKVSSNTNTQSALLRGSYDMLFYKGGTFGYTPLNAFSVMIIARSKSTGKVYAVVDMNTTTGQTATDNKYVQCKKVLDYLEGGSQPSFSRGGIVAIEMPQFSPTLWNRFDWANRVDGDNNALIRYAYSKDYVGYPCSMSKVMTAILLCENFVNLNTIVMIHERDRQPPSGFDFKAGDQVRVADLLKCLMVQSSNTSAYVIARVVGGILLDRDANVME